MPKTAAAESAQPQPATPVQEKKTAVLHVSRIPTRANIKRVEWDVTVSPETTVEDLLTPTFWTHVSGTTFYRNQHNKVAVHWEDGRQYAELYVRQSGATFAVMALLGHWQFAPNAAMSDPSLYSVSYSGRETKYKIVRKSDMQHIRDGFETEEDAYAYIKSLEQ